MCGIDKVRPNLWNHLLLYGVICRRWSSFEQADPPRWRVERAVAVVERWVDVVEEVPDYDVLASAERGKAVGKHTVSDHNAAHLIFRHSTVHDQ